jgi:hypothetical protein
MNGGTDEIFSGLLIYLPVGLKDALADAGERLPRQSVSSAISSSIRSDGFIGSLCLLFLSRFHASSSIE